MYYLYVVPMMYIFFKVFPTSGFQAVGPGLGLETWCCLSFDVSVPAAFFLFCYRKEFNILR